MAIRLLHLLLCWLLAGPLCLPARALSRPETRVGGSPDFSTVLAPEAPRQLVELHQEEPSARGDFAPALHKYLYCAADPVNMVDPSGHAPEGGIGGQGLTVSAIGQMATRGGLAIGRASGWAAQRINYAALRGLQLYAANEGWIALGTFVIPPAITVGLDLLSNNQSSVPPGNFPRGRMAENTFQANLGGNFPVVDHLDTQEQYVVSVRSHSLATPSSWERAVLSDIDEVREGVKGRLSGYPAGSRQLITIDPSQIRAVYLVQVVTEGELASQDTTRALANIRSQAGNIRVILATMRNWRR